MPTSKNVDDAVLIKMGELGARVEILEQEVSELKNVVDEMRFNMATKSQLDAVTIKLDEIGNWMSKGSGAMWLLATIIPGGIWLYSHWDNIKGFLRGVLDIH